jgi:SAM domain (Sterile alpha motif)
MTIPLVALSRDVIFRVNFRWASPSPTKHRTAMQQVADWLEKLGLGQYAQRFAENDISFVILPDLTDQDLEKIGVASLGHRRPHHRRDRGDLEAPPGIAQVLLDRRDIESPGNLLRDPDGEAVASDLKQARAA